MSCLQVQWKSTPGRGDGGLPALTGITLPVWPEGKEASAHAESRVREGGNGRYRVRQGVGRHSLREMGSYCRVYSSGSQLGWKGGLCPQMSHLAMPEDIFHGHDLGQGVKRGQERILTCSG